mmetsp:Transcript_20517/g.62569  ORF Transcript_20517/g.62569 Transcript_20517/m.62569 type:complete len:244 (+) Transcript_20517:338-1069(+)
MPFSPALAQLYVHPVHLAEHLQQPAGSERPRRLPRILLEGVQDRGAAVAGGVRVLRTHGGARTLHQTLSAEMSAPAKECRRSTHVNSNAATFVLMCRRQAPYLLRACLPGPARLSSHASMRTHASAHITSAAKEEEVPAAYVVPYPQMITRSFRFSALRTCHHLAGNKPGALLKEEAPLRRRASNISCALAATPLRHLTPRAQTHTHQSQLRRASTLLYIQNLHPRRTRTRATLDPPLTPRFR